jgi:hypothetical protein
MGYSGVLSTDNLYYKRYITPQNEKIIEFARRLSGKTTDKKRILTKIRLKMFPITVVGYMRSKGKMELQTPEETLQKKKGSCLCYGLLICSVLRALKFSEEEVFVVVGMPPHEEELDYGCHAWLLVKKKGKPLSEGLMFCSIRTIITEKVENTKIKHFLWFNDKKAILFPLSYKR